MNRGSICTCSPKSVLTKGAKAHQRKVGSARLIVYTAHLIRAGLDFQDRVPVLSVLGLPLDMVQFFWYAYFFHLSRAKNFRPCKWGVREMADAVYAKGAALPNCWGFVDGTVSSVETFTNTVF